MNTSDRLPGSTALFGTAIGRTTQEIDKLLDSGSLISKDLLPIFAGQLVRAYGASEESLNSLAATSQRARNAFTLLSMAAGDNGFEQASKDFFLFIDQLARSDTAVRWAKEFGQASKSFMDDLTAIPPLLDRMKLRDDTFLGGALKNDIKDIQLLIGVLQKLERITDMFNPVKRGGAAAKSLFGQAFEIESVKAFQSEIDKLDDSIGIGLKRSFSYLPVTFDQLSAKGKELADDLAAGIRPAADDINLLVLNSERYLQTIENNIVRITRDMKALPEGADDYAARMEKANQVTKELQDKAKQINEFLAPSRARQLKIVDESLGTKAFEDIEKQFKKMNESLLTSDQQLQGLLISFTQSSQATTEQKDTLEQLIQTYRRNFVDSLEEGIALNEMMTDAIWRGVDAERAKLQVQMALGQIDQATGSARLEALERQQAAQGGVNVATGIQQLQQQNQEYQTAIALFDRYGAASLDLAKALQAVKGDMTLVDVPALIAANAASNTLTETWKRLTAESPLVALQKQLGVVKASVQAYSEYNDVAIATAYAQALIDTGSAKTAASVAELTKQIMHAQEELDVFNKQANAVKELEGFNQGLADQVTSYYSLVEAMGMFNDAKMAEAYALALTKTAHIDDVAQRDTAINAIMAQTQHISELTDAYEQLVEISDRPTGIAKLAEDLTAIGELSDAPFAGLIKSLAKVTQGFSDWQASIAKTRKNLATLSATEESAKKNKDQIATLTSELTQLEGKRTEMALSGFSEMTTAASQMFKEQSKEQKALVVASQAANAILVGLKMQEAAANALAAITAQGSAPPPASFGFISAMAGIMAGLGVFSGSVSGGGSSGQSTSQRRQERQGTGTVLGMPDAKSESLSNSLDRLVDLADMQIKELKDMQKHLASIDRGIFAFGNAVLRQMTGFNVDVKAARQGMDLSNSALDGLVKAQLTGLEGLFKIWFGDNLASKFADGLASAANFLVGGKTKVQDTGIRFGQQSLGDLLSGGVDAQLFAQVKKEGGLLGSDKKKILTQDLDSLALGSITAVFRDISASVGSAIDILGIETSKSANDFMLDIGMISLEGLSPEDQAKEIQAVLSRQADLLVDFLVPGLKEFQNGGEGLLETLVRAATEVSVVKDRFSDLGMVMPSVDILGFTQGVIEAAGGFEEFIRKTARFADVFLTPVEKIGSQINKIKRQIQSDVELLLEDGFKVDADVFSSIENFREFFDSVKDVVDARQLALIQNAGIALADYFDALEDGADILNGLDKGLAKAIEKIREFLDSLRISDLSPLTNRQKLEEAERQFESLLKKAQGGDIDALGNITGIAGDFLSQARDFYASSENYTRIFDSVTTALERLVGLQTLGGTKATDLSEFLDTERSSGMESVFENIMTKQMMADATHSQELIDSVAITNQHMEESQRTAKALLDSLEKMNAETGALNNAQLDSLESANEQNRQLINSINEMLEVFLGRNGGAVVRTNSQDVSRI